MPASRRDCAALVHRARQHEREARRSLFSRIAGQREALWKEQPILTRTALREMVRELQQI